MRRRCGAGASAALSVLLLRRAHHRYTERTTATLSAPPLRSAQRWHLRRTCAAPARAPAPHYCAALLRRTARRSAERSAANACGAPAAAPTAHRALFAPQLRAQLRRRPCQIGGAVPNWRPTFLHARTRDTRGDLGRRRCSSQQSCLARSVVLVDRWWQIHFGAQELDDSNRTTPKTLYFSETSSQDAFSAA